MKLKNLTSSEYRASAIFHPEENGKEAQFELDLDIMFNCMVSDIENLSLTDENKKTIEIKTGQDILDNPGINDLYLELVPVLIKMEARIDSKN